jgi:hypothetical protein
LKNAAYEVWSAPIQVDQHCPIAEESAGLGDLQILIYPWQAILCTFHQLFCLTNDARASVREASVASHWLYFVWYT